MGHNRGELLLTNRQNQSSFYPPSNRLTRIFLSCMLGLGAVSLPACNEHEAHAEGHVHQKIVVTNPKWKDVDLTEQFVCQIHSQRHIQVRALQNGYLEKITIKKVQLVKKGDLLFKVIPTLYQAKFAAESAEAELALLERNNNRRLFHEKVISEQMLKLYDAKLLKAQAKADLAKAELSFSEVKAYFDGIVDRQYEQQGSLVKEGNVLTTLSDNLVMWVYFNVPEKHYIQYMSMPETQNAKQRIELRLADGSKFSEFGSITAIEGNCSNQTGSILFRADFSNPRRLLRHGMTGNRAYAMRIWLNIDRMRAYKLDSEDVVKALIARLGPDEGKAALREPNVSEFDITGRPMRNWVTVEREGVADEEAVKE